MINNLCNFVNIKNLGGIILIIAILISIYLIFKYYFANNLKENLTGTSNSKLIDYSGLDGKSELDSLGIGFGPGSLDGRSSDSGSLDGEALDGPTLPFTHDPTPTKPGCWYIYPTGCTKGKWKAHTWKEDEWGYKNLKPPSNSSAAACKNRQKSLIDYCGNEDISTHYVAADVSTKSPETYNLAGEWTQLKGGPEISISQFGNNITTIGNYGAFGTGKGLITNNKIVWTWSAWPKTNFYGIISMPESLGSMAKLQIDWYKKIGPSNPDNLLINSWEKFSSTTQKCEWTAYAANFDYPYNDILEQPLSNISLNDCKEKCESGQETGCKGIVYADDSKTCWLKNKLVCSGNNCGTPDRRGYSLTSGCTKPINITGYWTESGNIHLSVKQTGSTATATAPAPYGAGKGTISGSTMTWIWSGVPNVVNTGTIVASNGDATKITWQNGVIWTKGTAPTGKCVTNKDAILYTGPGLAYAPGYIAMSNDLCPTIGNSKEECLKGSNSPTKTAAHPYGWSGIFCPGCCKWESTPAQDNVAAAKVAAAATKAAAAKAATAKAATDKAAAAKAAKAAADKAAADKLAADEAAAAKAEAELAKAKAAETKAAAAAKAAEEKVTADKAAQVAADKAIKDWQAAVKSVEAGQNSANIWAAAGGGIGFIIAVNNLNAAKVHLVAAKTNMCKLCAVAGVKCTLPSGVKCS